MTLNSSLFLFLNFIVVLSAVYFGGVGPGACGVFSILAILMHSLRISQILVFPILALISTICIVNLFSLKISRKTRGLSQELDNVEEEKNIVAVELEHARVENDSLKEKLKRYAALKWLTEILSTTVSWDKVTYLITGETLQIINKSCVCLLYLVDGQKQGLELINTKVVKPQYEPKLKKGDLFDNWVFKHRVPLMVLDTKKDFRFNLQELEKDSRGVRSLISAALMRKNRLLGILRLDNVEARAYGVDDLRLLDIISDLAAVAIENTLLFRQTQKLAITDGLTGLFVHRHFQRRFEEEVSRALWTNSQFAFLMLDIDDFKKYNDKYGHIAGDIILKQIAKLIASTVRPGDIVARYGGEEFAVLLVDTTPDRAQTVAEQIRERIEQERFILRREVRKVQVSGGLSFFPDDGRVKDDLIKKADQGLYKAKAEGKNRICIV